VEVFILKTITFLGGGVIMKKIVEFYYRCSFKVCLRAFLSLIGLMLLSSSAFALQSGDFTYTESAGTITITKYIGSGGNVVIPGLDGAI
jgi:hypothetical protein